MRKAQQDLRESREREVGLQGRLEKAKLELKHTTTQVTDLQQIMEKGQQDLRESEERETNLQGRLKEAELELMDTKVEVADL